MIACLVSLSPASSPQACPNLPLNAVLLGGNKQAPAGWVLHKQFMDLENVALEAAEKPCANWAWVAGIVAMAEARGARIEQQYLVDRLYGGSVCLTSPGDLDDLAQRISHEYVLSDGQKFRLAAQFTPGAPTRADPLIVHVRQGLPLMLLWRDHTYLLTGLNYDEYVAPTGNKMFIITELRLFDAAAQGAESAVKFVRERDDPDDLKGVLDLSVIYPK